MSEKYKFRGPEGLYFVTMATVGWVDLFTRWELKHVIIDSLAFVGVVREQSAWLTNKHDEIK
jgi:hypothetical protein